MKKVRVDRAPAAIPFDESSFLRTGCTPFGALTDEEVESLPVSAIGHALATLGNDGHQVIDGRSTSLINMMSGGPCLERLGVCI